MWRSGCPLCQCGGFAHLGVNAIMADGIMLGCGDWVPTGSVLGYGVNVEGVEVLLTGTA
jgi:hypothetical protein